MINRGKRSEQSWTLLSLASVREHWPSDELARIVEELQRLNIEVEHRDDAIGIVGTAHTEALLTTSRQPIRIAIYRLIRAEQKRQQQA